MRMPYFDDPAKSNSVLSYYTQQYGITTQPFPDPGSPAANTGIFLNDGYGPVGGMSPEPQLLLWETEGKPSGSVPPPTPQLAAINEAFTTFLTTFQNVVSQLYATDAWESFWQAVSVEGRWTEPALRGGLDAAIHLIQNTGGQFVPGFTFGDYPRYSAWSPAVGSSDATRALGRTIEG